MNQRLKLLAQKKEPNISSAANLSISNVQSNKNISMNQYESSDEDDNHNDILSVLQKDKPIQAKSENSWQMQNTAKTSQQNFNQNNKYGQQENIGQNSSKEQQQFSKISKEEEVSQTEQDNYLKKKLKKPITNVNPVLMKFQNKQNNSKMQKSEQNIDPIEPKIEEGTTSIEGEEMNFKNLQIEKEQSLDKEAKLPEQKDQNIQNKRQFSVSVNSVDDQSRKDDSSNQLIMRIQGKVNDQKSITSPPNKFDNQNKLNKGMAQGLRGLNQIQNTSEDDDEDDDIEHLKQISKSATNTQISKPQSTNLQTSTSNQKFSILPIMNDRKSESILQPKLAQPKGQVNKQNEQNALSQSRNDQDLSMFDAIFDANEELSRIENDKMDEEAEDKKSVADVSMFIHIQQESEDDADEIELSKRFNQQINNQKLNQNQRIPQNKINSNQNVRNIGLQQNTLNKLKDQQNQKIQNYPEKYQTEEENNQNNLFSKSKQSSFNSIQNKLQQNTNVNNNQQQIQKLNFNEQKQSNPQINVNKAAPNREINQTLNRNAYQETEIQDSKQASVNQQIPQAKSSFQQIQSKLQNSKQAEDQALSNSMMNNSYADQNKRNNNIYKTPVQNSKTNNYQQKITQYSSFSNKDDEDDFYQNFESSYQNIMYAAKPNNNKFNNQRNMNDYDESMNLTKGNISRNQMNNTSYQNTTNKKLNKKNIPQVTPYKINLRLYQKKKKIKQSVEECKVWHYYLDKMYNLTSQQFELKLANSTIPKELKEYNIKQIFRGAFNNKKIPFLAVIMIEFEILHQIVKATLLDFSCSIIGSFSKNLFMDDMGENNQSLIVKKEEPEDEEEEEDDDQSDDDFINRNNRMRIEEDQIPSQKQDKKKKEKKMDFSTVYTLNHERGTQISLKLNTLLVLKDVTVIQQNEEPPFLNISEKNVIQVVYPF